VLVSSTGIVLPSPVGLLLPGSMKHLLCRRAELLLLSSALLVPSGCFFTAPRSCCSLLLSLSLSMSHLQPCVRPPPAAPLPGSTATL